VPHYEFPVNGPAKVVFDPARFVLDDEISSARSVTVVDVIEEVVWAAWLGAWLSWS
jgi:hypothetical protein